MNERASERAQQLQGITPSQTVGPFFAIAFSGDGPGGSISNDLGSQIEFGERIRIEGQIIDGEGAPVSDALVEIWQADPDGHYPDSRDGANAAFLGIGRALTDSDGRYWFVTVKPGPLPAPQGGRQAPHVNIGIFGRGIMLRLFTRLYFSDEIHNANDPILSLVPGERCLTLIAHRQDGEGLPTYTFDIRLQGEGETVFFEV